MSSLLLAIHSYPGANEGVARHWPHYEKSGASKIIGIGTVGGKCKWPEGVHSVEIGADSYIAGDHLPRRLVETMRLMLLLPYERFCIIEWDCLFFHPLPEFTGMVAFHAGNNLPGMKAQRFWHCPWAFDFETGSKFVFEAQKIIDAREVEGHECSPDVFFGWVCERAGIDVKQPWIGYTRNTIESAQDAEDARKAVLAGAMSVHGCKSRATYDYLMT